VAIAGGGATVGYIDPTTGQYAQIAHFRVGDPDDSSPATWVVHYSPDFLRYAVAQNNPLHAGWIDQNGKFTDVNADAPNRDHSTAIP
jgi:hypothetical protein